MNMIVRPCYRGHPVLLFATSCFMGFGFADSSGAGILIALLCGGFNWALLLFSVKGTKYIFKDGLLTIKHWTGPSKSMRLNQVQIIDVKIRSFGAGDVALYTPSGKVVIKKIRHAQKLANKIQKQIK